MPQTDAVINESALAFELDIPTDRWSCSPAMLDLYGFPPTQNITTQLMVNAMIHDDRDVMLERFAHHTSTPGPFQYEYRITDPAGRLRHLVLVGFSEDSGGQVKRMTGYLVDISDTLRDEAHAAVSASAEHRAVIEQAKGALMAGFGISAEAAFGLLRRCSNQHNVKLTEVAQRIVEQFPEASFSDDAATRLRQLLNDWDGADR